MSCIGTTINIYHNKLQKNCSKIHSYEKVFLGKMTCNFFKKVIILAYCILFAPTYILPWFKLGWQWWNSSLTNIVFHFLVGHGFLILQHIGCDAIWKKIMWKCHENNLWCTGHNNYLWRLQRMWHTTTFVAT
jgi:hypothetical protein